MGFLVQNSIDIEDERKALEKSGGQDNDDKQFPHAACIIDVTRCSVAFANVEDLISYPLVLNVEAVISKQLFYF